MSDGGSSISRLRGQLELLEAIWDTLPPGIVRGWAMLQEELAATGHPVSEETLCAALRYLEAAGILQRDPGERWRRKEGK